MTDTAGKACAALLCAAVVTAPVAAQPVGTAFTYQGRLADGGAPASGPYDLRFVLFDAPVGGSQVGPVVSLEDIQVVSGLFTVSVDFGAAAFAGSARFMEVAVRPGASTGPFTVVGARQEVKPTPQATYSASAPWAGVTGKPAGFADDADNDALGALTCAPGQVAKWSGSAWTCGPDANSGGTVSSVATGAGLTGGPITGSGTVAVAGGGITTPLLADAAVTSPKIANGAVGLTQINSAQVQARIGGTCPPGQYLRGINADGTVVCEPFYAPTTVSAVDEPTTTNSGEFSSIAIAPDGKPVIGCGRADDGSLVVAKCGNAGCTTSHVQVVDDPPLNYVATYTSLAIGADGLPVMAYNDSTARDLKLAKCGNPACTASVTITTVDPSANTVGDFPSLAIGTDGFPIVSYYDLTARALKVAKCGNAACSAGNSVITVDNPANDVGLYSSIEVAAGRPVISYYDRTAGALKVLKCGNAACTSGNTVTTVDDPANDVGLYTSIAIGNDGLPVISYQDSTAGSMKVAKCGNDFCNSGNVITTVDNPSGPGGGHTAIAIGADGRPLVSYYNSDPPTILRVAHCANASCSAIFANIITDVAPVLTCPVFAGCLGTSIAIGTDGLPVISYQSASKLMVAKCGTQGCE